MTRDLGRRGQVAAPLKEQTYCCSLYGFPLLFNSVGGKIKHSSYPEVSAAKEFSTTEWLNEGKKDLHYPVMPVMKMLAVSYFGLEDSLDVRFGSRILPSALLS